jgi:hypothetical protein
MTLTNSTTFEKTIKYNRDNRDYDAYLGGDYKGSFSTYHQAEVALDQIAYDLLADEAAVAVATCPGTGLADCGTPVTIPGDFCQRCKDVLDRVFFEALAEPVPLAPLDSVQSGQEAFKLITQELAALRQPADRFSVTLRAEPAQVVPTLAPARECPICGGNHHVQRCPRIWLELRRPDTIPVRAAA